MKTYTTILFSIFMFFGFVGSVMGQTTLLSDDFETGNLNSWTDDSTDNWEASTLSPLNGSYSMKHVDNGFEGISYVYSSITSDDIDTKVTTWQFNLANGSFGPSGSNYFGVAIMGDENYPQSGTFNGYVVGVNFTGTTDELILYKVTNGSYSTLISTGYTWGSSDLVGIKIERNSNGVWQFQYDTDGDFDNLTLGGSATDTDHTTFSFTSVYFEYTSSRAGLLRFDDLSIQQDDENIKAEPADHVTTFGATGSIKTVNLSWLDVSSSPVPDGYLIKASETGFGSITDPTDANAEADDTDLSDGSAVLNVLQGTEEASFSGLDGETTYYFKIYPYTNSGSDIDYKIDGSVPQDDATTSETPPIILNEFLADPAVDANGDGTFDSGDDEFLEFVNTGDFDLDISNWTIDEGAGLAHTFPASTILKPMQAIVIFSGGNAVGDFGGSLTQISTEGYALNNTGDDIILKNNSGVEIINYTYGSEANSDESVTRNPDLTGAFEQHETADSDDASSFSPGTRINSTTFQPSVSITGNEGWRIVSSPTTSNTYADLLDTLWTQGIATGADVTNGTANVQSFDGTSFSPVNDLTTTMTPGEGFIVYVYNDDDYDGTPDGFPKTLELFSVPNSGSVSPTITPGANEWTLVGNPYYATVDWDELTKTDLTGTVYVYDHSYGTPTGDDVEATGSAGSYRTWNGSSGSLTDGLIAPFQGFWVQNSSSVTSPALTFEEEDQTTGGVFYKENEEATLITIKLKGEMENMFSEAFLSFTEDGLTEKDNFDALKLTPLDVRDYISVSTVTANTKLDINNLPEDFGEEHEVPVSVEAFKADQETQAWIPKGGQVRLSWPEINNIPDNWSLTLQDFETGESIDMRAIDSYTFTIEGSAQKAKNAPVTSIFNPQPPQTERMAKGVNDLRFSITLSKGEVVSNESGNAPEKFALDQNYPNPFNPTTNIEYTVSEPGNVNLTVYNVMGQRVATLVSETKSMGTYRVNWDASGMASGIYYYRLQSAGEVLTRQMTLIK